VNLLGLSAPEELARGAVRPIVADREVERASTLVR